MAKKILVEPADVWEYLQENVQEMKTTMFQIASNDDFGIVIYLTESDNGNMGKIIVCADDNEVYSEKIISESDGKKTAERIYNKYLTEKVVEILSSNEAKKENETKSDDEDESMFDYETLIEQREEELDDALCMFLDAVCESEYSTNYYFDPHMFEDIKEHFLEYLARKWNTVIRRPMFIEDENGEDFFEEYPYEYLIFDDEDNPIYKS